ncbi:MAG: amidohydrolase/deacetylase family metallohydrolase [Bryobacterales bacterium]|nr:amidohydrolase/deacetylase family metallohydrolase [Bryobacterales bacterium]
MVRRSFLRSLGGLPGVAGGALAQRARIYDMIIRNGEVRDPGRNFRQRADVAVQDGRIAAIESEIPPERGREVIDAKGLYVTPGLVDLHTHCFYGASGISVEADPIGARSGVTTWVDAGSFTASQVAAFRRFTVGPAQSRIFGYVHLYPDLRNPDVDVVKYVRSSVKETGQAVEKNRDIVLGVKVYVGANMNGRYSLDFMKIGRELGDQFKAPLMVHVSFTPPELPEVLALMRTGDVLTHCNNGHTLSIVDSGYSEKPGNLRPGVKEARERGVWFDVGHGAGSFNFNAARNALRLGFPPDCISTDLHTACINGPTYDLPTTMSKYLYLGMSFDDVLLRSTYNPAKIIGRVQGLGTLEVGAPADIALLALEEGQFRLVDCQRNAVMVRQRIASRLTICRGKRLTAPV